MSPMKAAKVDVESEFCLHFLSIVSFRYCYVNVTIIGYGSAVLFTLYHTLLSPLGFWHILPFPRQRSCPVEALRNGTTSSKNHYSK